MANQTTQATLRSLDQAEFLITSTLTSATMVSERLGEIFQELPPTGEGEEVSVPDWIQVQRSNAALLLRASQEVKNADKAHRLDKLEDRGLRRKRRQLIDRLKQRHRDYRKSFAGTYGEDSLGLVGLDAPPARRFVAVREQALEVLERMRTPELLARLPAPRSGQTAQDLVQLADDMEAEILEFEEVMAEIQQMHKRRDESLIQKREAMQRFRRIYLNVARVQESYYRIAGFDDLAERIRVADPARRSASSEEDDSKGSEPTDEPSEPESNSRTPSASETPASSSEESAP